MQSANRLSTRFNLCVMPQFRLFSRFGQPDQVRWLYPGVLWRIMFWSSQSDASEKPPKFHCPLFAPRFSFVRSVHVLFRWFSVKGKTSISVAKSLQVLHRWCSAAWPHVLCGSSRYWWWKRKKASGRCVMNLYIEIYVNKEDQLLPTSLVKKLFCFVKNSRFEYIAVDSARCCGHSMDISSSWRVVNRYRPRRLLYFFVYTAVQDHYVIAHSSR